MDEWELMVTTEDLEPGEYVKVVKGSKTLKMMIVKEDRYGVMLKGTDGSMHQFSRNDLCDRYGWMITGKAKGA